MGTYLLDREHGHLFVETPALVFPEVPIASDECDQYQSELPGDDEKVENTGRQFLRCIHKRLWDMTQKLYSTPYSLSCRILHSSLPEVLKHQYTTHSTTTLRPRTVWLDVEKHFISPPNFYLVTSYQFSHSHVHCKCCEIVSEYCQSSSNMPI